MKKLIGKRLAAAGLAVALVVSAVSVPNQASAATKAKKVKVNKKKVTLYPKAASGYGSIKIKASVTPKKAKAKFKWKSNKKKVATVNAKGLIKAKKAGKATITVTDTKSKKKATVKVTVKKIKKKVKSVTVKNKSLTLAPKQTASIGAGVSPKNATLKALTYSSSATKVAKVSAKGVVTGVAAGTAVITVKAVDGSKKKATVSVKVVAPANPTKTPTASKAPTPTNSAAPTPSASASTEPTPSASASTAPTPDVSEEPGGVVKEDDPDIEGNTKYTMDTAEEDYYVDATVLGENYSIGTNENTYAYVQKALSKAVAGLSKNYASYKAKALTDADFEIADDVVVTVTKLADSEVATVILGGVNGTVDGTYTLKVARWCEGENEAGLHSVYCVEFNNDANSIYAIVGDQGTATEGYKFDIETLKVKIGDTEKVCAVTNEDNDVSTKDDDIHVTVTYDAETGAGVVSAIQKDKEVRFTTDGDSLYTISLPAAYVDKYGIVIE